MASGAQHPVAVAAEPWWVRRRYLLLTLVGLVAAAPLHRDWGLPGGDWTTFATASDLLLHGRHVVHLPLTHRTLVQTDGAGLHLYARNPDVQIGPLALLATAGLLALGRFSQPVTLVVCLISVLPLVRAIESTAALVRPAQAASIRRAVLPFGSLVVTTWVAAFVTYRHLDDVLVALGAAAALLAVARSRPLVAGAAIGLALAAKPTALVLVPLLAAPPLRRSRRTWCAAAALCAGCACAAWLPFVVADSATVAAGRPQTQVVLGSGLSLLGLHTAPHALRAVQALGVSLAAAVVLRRGDWPLLLAVGVAVRVTTDAQRLLYYLPPLVAGLMLWALLSDRGSAARTLTVLLWLAAAVLPFLVPLYATGTVLPAWLTGSASTVLTGLAVVVSLCLPGLRRAPSSVRATGGAGTPVTSAAGAPVR